MTAIPTRALPVGFELVRLLGAGSSGEVVLAKQTSIGRLVALKRIHSYALTAPDAVQRFRREAKVVFSDPEVAAVGLTERQAAGRGLRTRLVA